MKSIGSIELHMLSEPSLKILLCEEISTLSTYLVSHFNSSVTSSQLHVGLCISVPLTKVQTGIILHVVLLAKIG